MSTTTTSTNPATSFYGGSRSVRLLGATLRALQSLSPGWGERAASRLFFTPLPWKLAGRRPLPAPWQPLGWRFEGVTLTAYRRADLPAGRPLVLLVHGWAGAATQMRALADALADAGLDPVLLDFPAHGRSGGWRATLPQFARALYAVTARLGPLHAVVGHSLGALAALHSAARGLPVERLVLLAPSAPPALFMRWFAGTLGLPEGVAQRMRERVERDEGVPLHEFEADWLGPRVTHPTLVVHDQGDRVVPLAATQRLVHALPRAQLHATQGLGHTRVLGDAAVVGAAVAHLTDTSGRAE